MNIEKEVVCTCEDVWVNNKPILYISHDDDDEWQFLCGDDHSEKIDDKAVWVQLSDVMYRDESISEILDILCINSHAYRKSKKHEWVIVDDNENLVSENIKKFGWHFMSVQSEDEEPEFHYSIGLFETFNVPEFIIIGTPSSLAHSVINNCVEKIKNGFKFSNEISVKGLLQKGYTCKFSSVDEKYYDEFLGYAIWYYQNNNFPVLQCVLQDLNHKYPWDNDFDPMLKILQLNLTVNKWGIEPD